MCQRNSSGLLKKYVHRFSKGCKADLSYCEGSKYGFPKEVKPNLLFEVKIEVWYGKMMKRESGMYCFWYEGTWNWMEGSVGEV